MTKPNTAPVLNGVFMLTKADLPELKEAAKCMIERGSPTMTIECKRLIAIIVALENCFDREAVIATWLDSYRIGMKNIFKGW